MCYNVAYYKSRQLREAKNLGAPKEEIERLEREYREAVKAPFMGEYFLISGFAHPKLKTFVLEKGEIIPSEIRWGLVPSWVKDTEQAKQIASKTLNARGETIFEKPSFRDSAKNKRCLISVTGFYEYHHKGSKKIPHFVSHVEQDGFLLGGLWSEWIDKSTGEIYQSCSIVTTKGNNLMSRIHNNPKLKEPRMPLILETNDAKNWLQYEGKDDIQSIIKPYKELLKAHPVRPIAGKNAVGNVPEAQEPYDYPELNEQTELF